MPNLGGWELIVLVGVLVLVFGAAKLPVMARSIGQSARVLKGEMRGLKDDGAPAPAPESDAVAPAAPASTREMPVVSAERTAA